MKTSDASTKKEKIKQNRFNLFKVKKKLGGEKEKKMKKKLIIVAVGALVICGLLLSSGALAGKPTNPDETYKGNGMPSGWHYNLNIIGKAEPISVEEDPNAHTMFVPEDSTPPTKIYMKQNLSEGATFQITDRNGFDGETEIEIAPGEYDVYARALGKPNRWVNITSWGNFTDGDGYVWYRIGAIDLNRTGGKPKTENINKLFYVTGDIYGTTFNKEWVFGITGLEGYWWDYDNHGLKLLQVRFYPRE